MPLFQSYNQWQYSSSLNVKTLVRVSCAAMELSGRIRRQVCVVDGVEQAYENKIVSGHSVS